MARIKENLIDDIAGRIEKRYGALAVKHMDADAYEELFQSELIAVMEGNTELVPPAETTCYISCGGARSISSISYGSDPAQT